MNILLVYPEYPDTFWSWKRVMKVIRRKAAFPPLGLLTVAAMLPSAWGKKLVDINVRSCKSFWRRALEWVLQLFGVEPKRGAELIASKELKWADYVFLSAMIAQRDSAKDVIVRCKQFGVKVVAGGPLFTTSHQEFKGVDHCVVGEAEDVMPTLVRDLENGCAEKVYASKGYPDIAKTPIALLELIRPKDYVSLSVQYSRGCPFDCEFCDVIVMNGRNPRVKSAEQFLAEIEAIYRTGFRGMVLVADDNLIGNKAKIKAMLSKLIEWQEKNGEPFTFATQASVNLADDEALMDMMAKAGFDQVFLGIETPSSAGLDECGKSQNQNRNTVESVKKIQRHGLHTAGGFIVGFDSDPPSIFDDQIRFIQEAGVVVAMVGLLTALPKTRLYKRLLEEGRILSECTGNNTDCFLNFLPKMDSQALLEGYKRVIRTIYSPEEYYKRICTFLKEYNPRGKKGKRMDWVNIRAFAMSIWYIGIIGAWRYKYYYWKALLFAALKHRRAFPEVAAMLIWGLHLTEMAKIVSES